MRVPSNSSSNLLLTQLQQLQSRQTRLQQQVSTGQKIADPSDNPAAIGRVLNYQAEKQQIQQFANNHSRAQQLLETSFAGIDQLKDLSDRADHLHRLRGERGELLQADADEHLGQQVGEALLEATVRACRCDSPSMRVPKTAATCLNACTAAAGRRAGRAPRAGPGPPRPRRRPTAAAARP